jgi:hypothetical protein
MYALKLNLMHIRLMGFVTPPVRVEHSHQMLPLVNVWLCVPKTLYLNFMVI